MSDNQGMSHEPMELVDRGDGKFYAPVAGFYKFPPIEEAKRAWDLTELDVGRHVRIQSGETVVTGKLTLVKHMGILGWRVGGTKTTNNAWVSVAVGQWTNVIYYADPVIFLNATT